MSAVRHLVSKAFPTQVRTKRVSFGRDDHGIQLRIGLNNHVELLNLSESGIAVCTSVPLAENVDLPVEIYLSETHPILTKGRAVWTRVENNKYHQGITFTSGHLPEGLLEAYEKASALFEEVNQKMTDYAWVDPLFKEITFEIKEYLEFVKAKMDQLQSEIMVDSQSVRESYDLMISNRFEPVFVERLKSYNVQLDKIFSKILDKDLKKKYINFFREKVGKLYASSPYSARALHKPRGYAGDYEMMNQIYRDQAEGNSFFEKLMHRYSTNEAAAQSVKYRKEYLIGKITAVSKNKDHVIVGSLASGPAREVVDFLATVSVEDSAKYTFVLMDQDYHSLMNAKRNITDMICKRGLHSEVHFLPLSVKNVLEQNEQAMLLDGIKFDLLYTAGLYDYLTQPVAQLLTAYLFGYLGDDGHLIIGNFHPNNPTKTISELAADWRLIHRNEDEMFDLISHLKVKSKKLHKDALEIDLFLEVER
jgi:hypothetical protein